MNERTSGNAACTVRSLTDQEVTEARAAIKQAQHLREQMREKRGGRILPESWELIRQLREERADSS